MSTTISQLPDHAVVEVRPGDQDAASQVGEWLQAFATSRDPQLRERIILAYLGLADRLASRYHADWELLGQLAEQLPNGKAKTAIEAAVAEVGPQEDEHLEWAQTKLAELGLRAVMDEVPPDPARLDRCVIQPGMKISAVHAAPMDKRTLLEGAKLPSTQATPTSRTSSPR